MPELKPCPFCGGKSTIKQGSLHDGCCITYWARVECSYCGAVGREVKEYALRDEVKEWATEVWNRRANECDRDELLNIADDIDRIADKASTDSIGMFLQVSTIRPAIIKAVADRIRKALGVE